MDKDLLKQFSLANVSKGSVETYIVGFIDCIIIPISLPLEDQQLYCSEYKRLHVIKFQSVVTPDGIILQMMGPWNGNRHDSGMLEESTLFEVLQDSIVLNDCSFRIKGTDYIGCYYHYSKEISLQMKKKISIIECLSV